MRRIKLLRKSGTGISLQMPPFGQLLCPAYHLIHIGSVFAPIPVHSRLPICLNAWELPLFTESQPQSSHTFCMPFFGSLHLHFAPLRLHSCRSYAVHPLSMFICSPLTTCCVWAPRHSEPALIASLCPMRCPHCAATAPSALSWLPQPVVLARFIRRSSSFRFYGEPWLCFTMARLLFSRRRFYRLSYCKMKNSFLFFSYDNSRAKR